MRGQGEACGGGQPSLRVEGGSGVRSEPAPDGVRARGLQAVCRVQEPAGQVPGARTVAGRAGAGGAHRRWGGPSALPPSRSPPGGLASLPKCIRAHGGRREPQGVSLRPTAPQPPSTSTSHLSAPWRPRSGSSLTPSPRGDQPWLGQKGREGQGGWMMARCPGLGVFHSRPGPSLRRPTRPADAGLSLARAHGSDFRVHRHALLFCPTCEGSDSVSALRAP